jgi:hypothetical protein
MYTAAPAQGLNQALKKIKKDELHIIMRNCKTLMGKAVQSEDYVAIHAEKKMSRSIL